MAFNKIDSLNCESLELFNVDIPCGGIMGGVKEVYINFRDNIASISASADGESISAIALTVDVGTGDVNTFKKFSFRPQTASLTSTATVDNASGSGQIQSDLILQFNKYGDTDKRLAIQSLMIAKGLVAIVRTNEDDFVFLGMDNDVYVSASTSQTGTAFTDGSYYNITLTDISKSLPYSIDSAWFLANIDNLVEI